jgi:hypothetical protein
MHAISLAPIQWATLRDIDAIEPLNDADAPCLAEIREVLKKHGKLERFGIALLHSHFQMEDGEILLETSNKRARSLTIRPAAKSEAASETVGTIWKLSDEGNSPIALCEQYCRKWGPVGHDTGHEHS